jgi:hypothetical protein
MYEGTVPAALRSIVAEHARLWPEGSDVYVGSSGTLLVERTLAGSVGARGLRLHSNDVTAAGCAVGWYFAGQPVPFTLREDAEEELGWLREYLDGPTATLATLMLGAKWLPWLTKPGAYHQRMVAGYRAQWPRLHAATVRKLQAATLRLESFTAGDVRQFLADAPPGCPVASFPPFWGGGGDTQSAGLEDYFTWPAPTQEPLDEDGGAELIDLICDRPYWILGLNEELPALEPYRVGYVRSTPRAQPWFVFAHPGVARYVGPDQKTAPVLMPRLGEHDQLGPDLRLHPLTSPQFNSLRSAYLGKGIAPGEPLFGCGVSSGGRIIGAFGYLWTPRYGLDAYLMSDFAVAPTRYRRLSKLIVMAAISQEAQLLMQRAVSRRVTGWVTTAFSHNPSAPKYARGVPGVVLFARKPCEDGVHPWQLQYGGPLGQWTLPEALARWSARHGQLVTGDTREHAE